VFAACQARAAIFDQKQKKPIYQRVDVRGINQLLKSFQPCGVVQI
jgi:hypothetical protein